jgi:hypothetical protein
MGKTVDVIKQEQAIELLATGQYNTEAVAEQVGVHKNTIYTWRRSPAFNEAVINRARQRLKDALPQVYEALLDNAKQGHHQHIGLLLKHMDNLEERAMAKDMETITFTWKRVTSDPSLPSSTEYGV